MRYLAEELCSQMGKTQPQDLSVEQVLGGLSGTIARLDTLETELTQANHEGFDPLIEMLKAEIRDLEVVHAALNHHLGEDGEITEEAEGEPDGDPSWNGKTNKLQVQLKKAVHTARNS